MGGVSVDTGTGQWILSTENEGVESKARPTSSYVWSTRECINCTSAPQNGLYGSVSAVAVAANCLIFGSEGNNDTGGCAVHFINKTMKTGTYLADYLWSYQPSSRRPMSGSPAIANGRVVIGSTDGCVYGFWNGTAVTSPVKVDTNGGTKVAGGAMSLSGAWILTAFPNPAAGGQITFALEGISKDNTLSIYEVGGRLVRELSLSGKTICWDTKDVNGRSLPSGSFYAAVKNTRGQMVRTFQIQLVR